MKNRICRGRKARRQGFTLVEVLLVLVILGVIGAMVIPNLIGASERSRIDVTAASIKNIENALQQYAIDIGSYPTTEQGLAALITPPGDLDEGQQGKYRKNGYFNVASEDAIKDAWGKKFDYKFGGEGQTKPEIRSSGPDGQMDTADDITNMQVAGANTK